ncbi:MAG: M23 family metallopeptidase, partial [Gemmatimonadota bacterium]
LIPVAARKFRSETLRVASRFTNPSARARERIRAERDLVAETVRRITADAVWSEPFAKPRDDVATSFFGTRRMFNGQVRSRHLGYDLRGEPGDPIYASNRGRVALARDLYFSGNSVYLDHGLGLFTAYFHMSEILVEEGEWVEKGRLIGKVGATGRVTGPHVHWSISFQGIPLDPEHLLTLSAPPAGPRAPETDRASSPR